MALAQAPSPDARVGSGYGTLKGHMGQSMEGDHWPYLTPDETEQDDDLDDEANDPKVRGEEPSIDQLNRRNYRTNSYVNGSTRGLTGIMASLERTGKLVEILAGARGQASQSYNVTGPNATTRTRPGRMTGSKRGYFSPPPPKEDDVELQAHSLKDIVRNQLAAPVIKAALNTNRAKRPSSARRVRNSALRAYIRDVLGDFDA